MSVLAFIIPPKTQLRVNARKPGVLLSGDPAGISQAFIANNETIALDQHGGLWPYFAKSDPGKYISASDLLNGSIDPRRIAGKIILIGTSAAGLGDIRAAPANPALPGVELHAQAIESVLANEELKRWNYAITVEILSFIGLAILMLAALRFAPFWFSLPALGIVIGAGITLSWWLFRANQILLDASFNSVFLSMLWIVAVYLTRDRRESTNDH